MNLDLLQTIEALKAAPFNIDGSEVISGVSIDTRTIKRGDWYVAIRGQHHDGHAFAEKAVESGAEGLIVDHKANDFSFSNNVRILKVNNTETALGQLAAEWRKKCTETKYVGITGSNGKSTTKEMIASVLTNCGEVLKTEGNFNNLIGMPLTMFRLRSEHKHAVVEMGMNRLGEIAAMTKILQPDVGLITNISPAHLEELHSIENVAKAKAELFENMPKNSKIVVNAEDPWVMRKSENFPGEKISFGMSNDCDVQFARMKSDDLHGTNLTISIRGKEYATALPVPGTHNVMNALAATAAALALNVAPELIMDGLSKFTPMRMRMERVQLQNGVQIINDCYNANLDSMKAALRTVSTAPRAGRFIAIIGDMLELGERSGAVHEELGETIAAANVDKLFVYGNFSPFVMNGAKRAGFPADSIFVFPEGETENLNKDLSKKINQGDVVLVKGSRGMHMEDVVEFLKREVGVLC